MLKKIKELSETAERILKLRTPPVGIKLLKAVKDIPEEAYRPKSATVCQIPAIARYHGIIAAGEKGKIDCPMGAASLGFSEYPPDFFETRVGEYSDDINVIKKMLLNSPRIAPNTFSAFIAGPISKMTVVPDVVSIYANTGQVLLLTYGVSWKEGNELVCKSNGHMGECSNTIARTYLNHTPTLSLPCYGARRRGLCTDSEMIVGIPPEKLEEIVNSVLRTYKCGRIYPIKVHGLIGHYSAHWPEVSDKLY